MACNLQTGASTAVLHCTATSPDAEEGSASGVACVCDVSRHRDEESVSVHVGNGGDVCGLVLWNAIWVFPQDVVRKFAAWWVVNDWGIGGSRTCR